MLIPVSSVIALLQQSQQKFSCFFAKTRNCRTKTVSFGLYSCKTCLNFAVSFGFFSFSRVLAPLHPPSAALRILLKTQSKACFTVRFQHSNEYYRNMYSRICTNKCFFLWTPSPFCQAQRHSRAEAKPFRPHGGSFCVLDAYGTIL